MADSGSSMGFSLSPMMSFECTQLQLGENRKGKIRNVGASKDMFGTVVSVAMTPEKELVLRNIDGCDFLVDKCGEVIL